MTTWVHYFENPAHPGGTTADARTTASADSQYLEHVIEIPGTFWDDLLALESDWAFVIQLHALLEAGFGDALTAAKHSRKRVKSMKMTQKVSSLFNLGRLTSEGKEYVRVFSRVRNRFVHDVRMIYASLGDEFSRLTPQDIRRIIEVSTRERPIPEYAVEGARSWPREMLMYGCMNVLGQATGGQSAIRRVSTS